MGKNILVVSILETDLFPVICSVEWIPLCSTIFSDVDSNKHRRTIVRLHPC